MSKSQHRSPHSRSHRKSIQAAGEPVPHDVIANRAYERYLAGGQESGHEVEDWLAAEEELLGEARQAKD